MIGMAMVFVVLTITIAVMVGAWVDAGKEERSSVLKGMFKGAVFSCIAFAILFVIVNLF